MPQIVGQRRTGTEQHPLTGSCSSTSMTARDSAPPHSDRNPAVAPRVRKANSAFNTTSSSAVRVRKNSSAYMTTMLDSPN